MSIVKLLVPLCAANAYAERYFDIKRGKWNYRKVGRPLDAAGTSAALLATNEAANTLALGPDHCDPSDIELAATVDAFDFAMEVERTPLGLRLTARIPQ